ncbi:MAG: translation initiation factor IF-2 [bacterium]|nr:translation initiation factor IF-2 [bacterium]MDT8395498.1 translation initiation factor IF-2 [bacterium]
MSTVRVDELAQEYGINPDELFSQLKSMGFDVVNVTSSVDRSLVDMVSDMLTHSPPREREESSKRRIVSVRKGEAEVEVRMEAAPEEGEPEEVPESDLPEEEAQPAGEEVAPAEVETAAAQEEPAAQGEEALKPVELSEEELGELKRQKRQIPLTTLTIEKNLSNIGTEIPTHKVIQQAKPVKSVETPVEDARGKGKKGKAEDEEDVSRKPGAKKGRKPSRKALIEDVEDVDALLDETADVDEPTLKVVEIKHTATPQPVRRKEQPMRRRGRKPKRRDRGEMEAEMPVESAKSVQKTIRITPGLTVSSLAGITGTKASEIIKVLFQLGIMATINQTLDPDTAGLVASELGFEVEVKAHSIDDLLKEDPDRKENLVPRPPVVTVMGHVDHGKTSLLDAVRETDVVSGEAGGITQHIGAHLVRHKKGQLVFLDTPGHEAFTAMRSRGAQVTDIVVLVVAADDGVKPQTIEAIDHAKAANVPILVAVNKMDKPEADADRVMRELSDHGVVSEEWGGDSLFCKVSAKKREGMDDLMDLILLQAEMLELKADPNREARGTVIESKLDKGKGPVATLLVQKGTLRPGDLMVAGTVMGRVRAMLDGRGKKIVEAGPSVPVEVQGLGGVPRAGEPFVVFTDELKAKRIAQMRETVLDAAKASHKKVTLEDLFTRIQEGEVKDLSVVLKADVQGSVGAIRDSLMKQATDEVRVKVIHEGTGGINEGDVMLASASNAIIIGFNVRPDNKALEAIRREQVDVRFYNVIYDIVKDIRDALTGLLAPVFLEEVLGRAEIRETFHVPKVGTIAGCYVLDGLIRRNAQVRVVRDGVVVQDGKIDSLRRFKDDVREVASGYECGIGLENFNDVKPGDILENYVMIEQEAKL